MAVTPKISKAAENKTTSAKTIQPTVPTVIPNQPTANAASKKPSTRSTPTIKKRPTSNNTNTSAPNPTTQKVAAKVVSKPITSEPTVNASASKSLIKVNSTVSKESEKKHKPEKVKMERDSFTMPKEEYAQIHTLKTRMIGLGYPVKKSELLRAGIMLLAEMDNAQLKAAMLKIPVIKTGRPKK